MGECGVDGLAALLEWPDAQDAIAASGQWLVNKNGVIMGARVFLPDVYEALEFDVLDLIMRETPGDGR